MSPSRAKLDLELHLVLGDGHTAHRTLGADTRTAPCAIRMTGGELPALDSCSGFLTDLVGYLVVSSPRSAVVVEGHGEERQMPRGGTPACVNQGAPIVGALRVSVHRRSSIVGPRSNGPRGDAPDTIASWFTRGAPPAGRTSSRRPPGLRFAKARNCFTSTATGCTSVSPRRSHTVQNQTETPLPQLRRFTAPEAVV